MGYIDDFLLNRFQRATDWLQSWLGVDNFMIAKPLIIVALFFLAIVCKRYFIEGLDFWKFVILVLYPLWIIEALILVNQAEKRFRNNKQFQSLSRLSLKTTRFGLLVLLFLIIFIFPESLHQSFYGIDDSKRSESLTAVYLCLFVTFFSLYAYFGSCTPKPRKPSKVKEFLSKLISFTIGSSSLKPV